MDILWVENHQRFSQIAVGEFLPAHNVTIVPSLAAARQALSAKPYRVVMVDYDLDDGKGADLVTEIKSRSDPPLVIATSSNAEGNAKLVSAGADAVCGKLKFANIEGVIQQAWKRRVR